MRLLTLAFLALAAPAMAQQASTAPAGEFRVLDKTTGELTDVTLRAGEHRTIGLLDVTLRECRYPAGNVNGDAYGSLLIRYQSVPEPVFEGWMIASSPALNALDHPRYDVWMLRCKT
ncbi:MAG: hypothetical protein CSA72_13265 [Rhodobacterales bacterium]|nr:MAG: hypothetical protein CSA72_13265 [Rhodobacterales bacterium]